MSFNIIFGPVNSRRFGKSIGIDLSPSKKQCNFDCLYCELEAGKTIEKYSEIIDVEVIILEVKKALNIYKNVDFITITANGEPTLYPYLEELIDNINIFKGNIRTLILSNASTIMDLKIQKILLKINVIKLSLDCATEKCLKKLDRIHKNINISDIKRGMLEFKNILKDNQLIIEILIIKNINDKRTEIFELNKFLVLLNPYRIDLNTIDRPPAYSVKGLNYVELKEISFFFDKTLNISISSRKNQKIEKNNLFFSEKDILFMLSRRPLIEEEIESSFNQKAKNIIKRLLDNKEIEYINNNGYKFLKIKI